VRFASIGSGSKGNGSVVVGGDTCVLVDCGFSLRETERRLARLGLAGNDISAVLVTHEHSDHISGVARLARKYRLPVYLTRGTAMALDADGLRLECINTRSSFDVGSLRVEPVAVPHDAREPCQFVIGCGGRRLGILSDLGHVTVAVSRHFADCDLLFLESNYDEHMLATGPYPWPLKARVGGDHGHLSNAQAAQLLAGVEHGRLQHLAMGHISENNNTPELVCAMLAGVNGLRAATSLADQADGRDWLDIH